MGGSCCNHDHLHDNLDENKNEKILVHHLSLKDEILCHFPYAIFSVALAMVVTSFISYPKAESVAEIAYRLFHNFHFLHLLFAASGTILMFRRYSNNFFASLIVGFTVPAVFCTVSDAFLPYLGGKMLGLDMHLHWCFLSHIDTVLPFLIGGVVNGWVMSAHSHSKQMFYSLTFHFAHIFVSSMAGLLYLISFGFNDWWEKMGFVFLYLVFAVLIPCIMSDVVVPVFFARFGNRKNKRV
ncbi:MAG: hypothetical protein V1646_04405 [bacterium]